MERTLVLIKPDGVQRALTGEVIRRFERSGLKIVGMKMVWADEEFARKHYTEDIAKRRGEWVRKALLDYIVEGPVVAMVLEGISAIDVVRKIVGGTEPKTAPPGTIRGDYSHHSFAHADNKQISVKNIIHASGDENDAKNEIPLWFSPDEIHTYKTVHEMHVF